MKYLVSFTLYFTFTWVSWAQVTPVYGTYGLYPQGSSRAMAMGGANTALSDDTTGLVYNPAGLAFNPRKFDLGGTINRTTDREDFFDNDATNASDFIQGGLALRFGSWAIGLGMSSPYQIELEELSIKGQIRIISGEVAIAKRFGKRISVGVAYHYEQMEQIYNDPAQSELKDTAETGYVRGGVAFRGKKFGLGVSYYPEREFDVSTEKNTQTGGNNWFRESVIPAKLSFGFYAKPSKHVTLVVDYDQFDEVENAIYVNSDAAFFSSQQLNVLPKKQAILHGGIEWFILKSKSNDVILRFGAYKEPNRLEDGEDRNHLTYGVEVRFGPAVLSVSFDQADNFNNSAQGFSLQWGSI